MRRRAAAAWRGTCTMNFAVSAWQPADACWACEPTKRQVAESADSATVRMVVVVAVAAVERW